MMSARRKKASSRSEIRVGIGGWSYAPWRQTFYPADLPQSRALEYARQQFSALEVNSTFYGTQKPATFAKWHDQTPDDFVFALKAPRAATHRTNLDAAAAAITRFIDSGLDRLQSKLGPLLWQFPAARKFDAEIFDRFLERLPNTLAGQRLHHVLDVRHASFACAEFVKLAKAHGVAIAYTDAEDVPQIADITGDVVYLRLREARARLKQGYTSIALKRFADAATQWRDGMVPSSLQAIGPTAAPRRRDTYVFFINGAKERAPAAATSFQALLGKN